MPARSPAAADTAAAPASVPTTKAPRRKIPVVAARRRRGRRPDEEEDEAGTEESYSDDSGLSEDDGSLMSEEETEDEYDEDETTTEVPPTTQDTNGSAKKEKSLAVTDTEIMQRGIVVDADTENEAEAVDFEEFGSEKSETANRVELEVRPEEPTADTKEEEDEVTADDGTAQQKVPETPFERRRREHEEYKKRRAEDPAFVPNRGRFFMHDQREGTGSNGFRAFGPGGRGRGFPRENQPPPPELAVDRWAHDMHEEVEPEQRQPAQGPNNAPGGAGRGRPVEQPRSFGRIVHKGTVQIQVNLPGMKAPITFSEVPWKSYTRLPFHRPPLRRDKPVRVALPEAPVRYIYPTVARSFIFIPRAMRPGGAGYGRGQGPRGRGAFGGAFAAGRSMYGGSTVYSPSVGMSRRSSVAYDTRQHTPAQHFQPGVPSQPAYVEDQQTRPPVVGDEEPSKPVVRLPNAAPTAPANTSAPQQPQPPSQAPTPRNAPSGPQGPPSTYTPSIHPAPYRENRATPKIPMYQPRPQKNINVAEIDSPHVIHFPQNYSGGVYTDQAPNPATTPVMVPSNGYGQQHSRQASYQSQNSAAAAGTSQQPQQFTYHPQPQQPYFQPQPHPGPHPQQYPMAMPQQPQMPMQMMQPNPAAPHFIPGPQPQPTYVSASPMPQPGPVPMQVGTPVQGPTTIAQESNGMVFYSTWDPNQAYYAGYAPAPQQMGMDQGQMMMGQQQPPMGTVYYYPPAPGVAPQGYYA